MRVLVCGGRDFTDAAYVNKVLDLIHAQRPITAIIEGGQRSRDPETREVIGGADWLGRQWALAHGCETPPYPANWSKYERAAGAIRNKQMLDEGKPDIVVAFPGGRGTADMVERAKKAGVTVRCYYPEPTGA